MAFPLEPGAIKENFIRQLTKTDQTWRLVCLSSALINVSLDATLKSDLQLVGKPRDQLFALLIHPTVLLCGIEASSKCSIPLQQGIQGAHSKAEWTKACLAAIYNEP